MYLITFGKTMFLTPISLSTIFQLISIAAIYTGQRLIRFYQCPSPTIYLKKHNNIQNHPQKTIHKNPPLRSQNNPSRHLITLKIITLLIQY
jgi:hypothetical protein